MSHNNHPQPHAHEMIVVFVRLYIPTYQQLDVQMLYKCNTNHPHHDPHQHCHVYYYYYCYSYCFYVLSCPLLILLHLVLLGEYMSLSATFCSAFLQVKSSHQHHHGCCCFISSLLNLSSTFSLKRTTHTSHEVETREETTLKVKREKREEDDYYVTWIMSMFTDSWDINATQVGRQVEEELK